MEAHPSYRDISSLSTKYPRAAGSLFLAYNVLFTLNNGLMLRLENAFVSLADPPEVYLAITTEDSSIVYYKISRGIVKPPL
ncbi:SEN15 family protein [Pleurotus pulmonarius]